MRNELTNLEEIYKEVRYKCTYKSKELIFAYEYNEFHPLPQLTIIKYDNKGASELPKGLLEKIIYAIDEIEDFGEAKSL